MHHLLVPRTPQSFPGHPHDLLTTKVLYLCSEANTVDTTTTPQESEYTVPPSHDPASIIRSCPSLACSKDTSSYILDPSRTGTLIPPLLARTFSGDNLPELDHLRGSWGTAGALLSKDPPCPWPGAQLLCDPRCLCDGETFCSPWYTDCYTLQRSLSRLGMQPYQSPWARHSDILSVAE